MPCGRNAWAGAVGVALWLVPVMLLAIPAVTCAQGSAGEAEPPETAEQVPHTHRPREPTRLYVSMWTTHLKEPVPTLRNNWVIGLSGRGFFGATFLNSFGRRAFTGGLQRTLISSEPATMTVSLGYRLGFVTGYDGRFMKLARSTPVLPLVQPFVTVDIEHVGFEVSYTFVVVSAAISYRF